MTEPEEIAIALGDGFDLVAAGLRRLPNGNLTADLQLVNGIILFADRVDLSTAAGRAAWARQATGQGRPTASRLEEAIRVLLLPQALRAVQDGASQRPSLSEQLVSLVVPSGDDLAAQVVPEAELFHTPDDEPYITIAVHDHQETHPLGSSPFRHWLARRYFEAHRKAPSAGALTNALQVLAGRALFAGPEYPVFVRLAGHEGAIFLDLADERWQVVRVDADGWQVIPAAEAPVRFRRPMGMLPLPVPVPGGTLEELRPLINVRRDDDFMLVIAWLLGTLRPTGPYPLLALSGEQGSGKTELARLLRALVDPNTVPLRAAPRDEGDLLIAATNGLIVGFDNLSAVPSWLSDALCRLATGGGLSKRKLYTDADEVLLEAQRPAITTSIEAVITRGDAMDRALMITLDPIGADERRTEAEMEEAFMAARPALLGALLSAVSTALRNLPATRLSRLPRLADFAVWVEAASPTLGWEPGAFLAAYARNRDEPDALALEALPVGTAVREFMADREAWSGTATELLRILTARAGVAARDPSWPKGAHILSGQLRRLAPNLRRLGISVETGKRDPSGDRRLVHLQRLRS